LLRSNIVLRAFLEGDRLCCFEPGGCASDLSFLDRVFAFEPQDAAFARLLARFGKADGVYRTQAHYPELATLLKPEDPALRASRAHLEEQAAAVTVESPPRGLLHTNRWELVDD